MPDYVAFFKIGTAPHKAVFAAENVSGAMNELVKAANVSSTMAITEFQILQVIGKNQYVAVATKNYSENRLVNKSNVVPLLPAPSPPTTQTETEYANYQLEQA